MATSQDFINWVCSEKIDSRFLKYVLLSEHDTFSRFASGTTHQTIYYPEAKAFHVCLPPLETQRGIASILGALDDKIELNRRTNRTLEEMARAVFRSWFVDFDPVRANAEGRRLEGLGAEVQGLFPGGFEDEAETVPEGWQASTVSDVAVLNGWTLGSKDVLPEIEYVEISEVLRGDVNQTSLYKRGKEPGRARRRLRHGDTVLSTVRPDRGAYFLALNPSLSLIASTGFAVATPTRVPWSFLHAALTQPEVFAFLGRRADGGAYPAVSPETVGSVGVAVPDNHLLETFASIAAPLYERMAANRLQSRALAETRDALLPRLLSGEVGVREAQEITEAPR